MNATIRYLCITAAICACAAWSDPCRAGGDSVLFEDAAAAAGIVSDGPSWGSAWGDFDGDGLPDLWLVNHWRRPQLFVNQGNGTFLDVAPQVVAPECLVSDTHGAAWADYDNDGDQDLYHLRDDDSPNPLPLRDFFFVNDGGQLVESAVSLGLEFPLGRGRMPLWLDYDRDGRLDAFRPTSLRPGSEDGPTVVYRQNATGFTEASGQAFPESITISCDFAILSDLSGDGRLELIPKTRGAFPAWVFELSTVPFADIREDLSLPTNNWVNDVVAGDFDGDLDNDLFMVRGEAEQGFVQVDDHTVELAYLGAHAAEMGIGFETTGDVTVDFYPKWKYEAEEIFIGAGGAHPESLCFTLCPEDSCVCGLFEHEPGVDPGMFIGYDSCAHCWQILRSSMAVNLVIEGTEAITGLSAIGWDPEDPPLSDHYLENLGDHFEDRSVTAGFSEPSSGRCVLSGDFDNDMDLDLYIVSTGPVENAPNILYRNDGGGSFHKVPDAGGAAGDDRGRGDAVSTVDYDGDGFLDLLVTNGKSKPPFEQDGPTFLFRNLGNDNHWIEIDLEGVASNRDGVGARLVATAGGAAQLREQGNGVHCRSQNHQRVHFGLGAHTMVDTLVIRWPSGIVQDTCDIAADQVIHIVENISTSVRDGDGAPSTVRLSPCRPNPFNPATTVSFSLPRSQPVDLSVHDTAGRLVRRLADGDIFPAGMNDVVWNGRDDAGRRVASGVYLLRLKAGSVHRTGKVVLLK